MPKSEQKGNGGLGNAHTNIRSKRKFLHIIKTFILSWESRAGDQTSRLRSKIVDSSELWQSNF